MKIDIARVAQLARLGLTEDEEATFGRQLESVLDFFSRLQEVDTDSIDAASHLFDQAMTYRSDEPGPSMPAASILANAPQKQDGYFVVPRVIRED